ncbi:MAG: FGGY-family carbohydrate kinase [Chitinophagaceae bacterium]
MEKFLGRKVHSINIVGGGAQSDVWCQIFADVMNVEIKQVQDPIYANARGAAWIAAVGYGRDQVRGYSCTASIQAGVSAASATPRAL